MPLTNRLAGVSLAFGPTDLTTLLGAAMAGVASRLVGGECNQAAGIEGPAELSQLAKAR